MTNEALFILIIGMGFAYFVGYFSGRNQSNLLSKLEKLKTEKNKPQPEKPTVILSSEYVIPTQLSNTVDDRSVGLVESKTPERLDWETNQAIEKEVRGY